MDQRPNNYNDQGPNGQGPNGNGGTRGPKNKSSLLVLLICVLATPADLDSVQQYFTKFHIERNHL